MNVRDIVHAYLLEHGYDGLYDGYGCSCRRDKVIPCGGPDETAPGNCTPGYECGADGSINEQKILKKTLKAKLKNIPAKAVGL